MFEYLYLAVLADVIILAVLYLFRHVIAVKAPVLIILFGLSVLYCFLYPYLAAWVDFPGVLYVYAAMILAGAGILYAVESVLFISRDFTENDMIGMTVSDAIVVLESVNPVVGHFGCQPAGEFSQADLGVAEELAGVAEAGQDKGDISAEGNFPVNIDGSETTLPEPSVEGECRIETVPTGDEELQAIGDEVEENAVVEPDDYAAEESAPDIPVEPAGDLSEELFVESESTVELSDSSIPWMLTAQVKEDPYEELPGIGETVRSPDPEPGNRVPDTVTDGQDSPVEADVNQLLAEAFNMLSAGGGAGAIDIFFKVLRMNPSPRLAVMLCTEICSIYLAEGRKSQALAVMEMLQDVWGSVLGPNDLAKAKSIIIQLRREV